MYSATIQVQKSFVAGSVMSPKVRRYIRTPRSTGILNILLPSPATAAEGTALVVFSHALEEATKCDTLILLHEGQIVWQGTPAQLLADKRSVALLLVAPVLLMSLFYYMYWGEPVREMQFRMISTVMIAVFHSP